MSWPGLVWPGSRRRRRRRRRLSPPPPVATTIAYPAVRRPTARPSRGGRGPAAEHSIRPCADVGRGPGGRVRLGRNQPRRVRRVAWWHGMAWHSMAWHGIAWPGLACPWPAHGLPWPAVQFLAARRRGPVGWRRP